jgi:hypothetical protein
MHLIVKGKYKIKQKKFAISSNVNLKEKIIKDNIRREHIKRFLNINVSCIII